MAERYIPERGSTTFRSKFQRQLDQRHNDRFKQRDKDRKQKRAQAVDSLRLHKSRERGIGLEGDIAAARENENASNNIEDKVDNSFFDQGLQQKRRRKYELRHQPPSLMTSLRRW